MAKPKKKRRSGKKAAAQWHEQRVNIREHRDRLRDLSGPRTGAVGWLLALIGMAALLALLNKPL